MRSQIIQSCAFFERFYFSDDVYLAQYRPNRFRTITVCVEEFDLGSCVQKYKLTALTNIIAAKLKAGICPQIRHCLLAD